MYATIGFDGACFFNQEKYELRFEGFDLKIVRECSEERESAEYMVPISNQIIIETTAENEYIAHEVGLKFLCELSWFYDVEIYSVQHSGGTFPIRISTRFAGHRGGRKRVDLRLYSPLLLNAEQRMAVGMYKEAAGNNSPFFQFLGFFKILEIRLRDGKQREEWLVQFFKKLKLGSFENNIHDIPEDIDVLQKELYTYARNGAAHGGNSLDANLLQDYKKMEIYCAIIRQAAVCLIVGELGVPRLGQGITCQEVEV